MYSDSDDDYEDDGTYKHERQERPCPAMRIMEDIEYRLKLDAYFVVTDEADKTPLEPGKQRPTDKELLRAFAARPGLDIPQDWRRWRIIRFFGEIEGFHNGELDLTGRWRWRYQQLLAKWNNLLRNLAQLRPHIIRSVIRRPIWDESQGRAVERPLVVEVFDDDDMWKTFQARWKLSSSVEFHTFIHMLQDVNRALASNPRPKFQQMTLVDLPPELLAIVFSYASVRNCAALGATCKFLHNVSFDFVYRTKQFILFPPFPPSNYAHLVVESNDLVSLRQDLTSQLIRSRDKCIGEMHFLMQRKDICAKLEDVAIQNNWPTSDFGIENLAAVFTPPDSVEVFGPLYERLGQLLQHLKLTTLRLVAISLNQTLASNIAEHASLVTLISSCSQVDQPLQQRIGSASSVVSIPRNERIRIVTIRIEREEHDSSWYILALCPRLVSLHVIAGDPRNGFTAPAPDAWSSLDFINHLEYLCLDGVHWIIHDLIDFFAASTARGPLRLTHFKLEAGYAVLPEDVGALLRAIHGGSAPLRVLVLDGIAAAPLELFVSIAQLFPNLEALSFLRRETDRQYQARPCQWEHPIYEYAQCLRDMTELRHFSANFIFDWVDAIPYIVNLFEPAVMDYLFPEQRYRTEQEERAGWRRVDGRPFVLPFIAHCPALESFALLSVRVHWSCTIKRSEAEPYDIVDFPLDTGVDHLSKWLPGLKGRTAWVIDDPRKLR
ncbi:hypothetical protein EXIGLDRAFT_841714 [Exidia glandulosa HHB12029]|uniref:F-box domain-containing protein n=1 Tax=Exidia glandulosa HHB12029 TaxID=1314781 RepID=A0A165DQ31_EXIGL|nr:hypothetical protein EXIGLDRAFT_841714 [Exidia glandulosa HHB12029]